MVQNAEKLSPPVWADAMNNGTTLDERYVAMLEELPMSDRFVRAMALTAYVRGLAWQGAVLHSGGKGNDAVIDRFLRQLYGADIADRVGSDRRSDGQDG